jgi:hypothetical protein
MAVTVKGGESFEAGEVAALFEFRAGNSILALAPYAVTADWQRFLINAVVESQTATPLTVVVNWTAELKQ